MTTIDVQDVPDQHRYEARIDGDLAGFIEYRGFEHGGAGVQVVLFHTEVDPAFGGKGVGSVLARGALDDLRARGARVIPECTFVAGWIAKHEEYADLVVDEDDAVPTA
ncbi:GNAT family N-acetyltransferase [Pengzhenrongella phosphoraccumulans]|uniref:GNAT family N-acetyltransferase n=1 Tax=Pengzhenrongella phosphoraccumulans TaxID=3114394 RepID=UPI00388F5367